MDSSGQEIEKIYPTDLGILCDPQAGLTDLSDALEQDLSASAREAAATRAAELAAARRQAGPPISSASPACPIPARCRWRG